VRHDRIRPITKPIPADRQGARRHYGVHPYFTRRAYNVVRTYIGHFTNEGETVLDPFGGSGVTAIEAALLGRNGIHNDINPFANFIARSVMGLTRGKLKILIWQLDWLKEACAAELSAIERGVIVSAPADFERIAKVSLPKNADVNAVRDLFTPRQFASIGIIRKHILRIPDTHARDALLLAWSATLPKLTRTFLSANGRAQSRGGSSIFSIYRYKVAANPIDLPAWETFEERARNIINAKQEIGQELDYLQRAGRRLGNFHALNFDVRDLPRVLRNRVDFIFTDPPYGGHIAYLDLSSLWMALLALPIDEEMRLKEIIVGGDASHTEARYMAGLAESIRVCVDLLKPNRWLSVVFQHWYFSYFATILEAAAEAGAELRAAVSQVGDPIWSMHKKKNAQSVLAGEFILTFQNTLLRQRKLIPERSFDLERELDFALRDVTGETVFGESVLNRLVIVAWQAGALGKLNISKDIFSELMESHGWAYDQDKHFWTKAHFIRQGRMFS
jgi:16S rRNA G966 N2-methylase RsmD